VREKRPFSIGLNSQKQNALSCLRATVLTFYDFPAEHWVQILTTNPIGSTFAKVRLRMSRPMAVSRAPARWRWSLTDED
jgi:hypothetical protein